MKKHFGVPEKAGIVASKWVGRVRTCKFGLGTQPAPKCPDVVIVAPQVTASKLTHV